MARLKLVRRGFIRACAISTALVIGALIFWMVDPVGFRLSIFQPLREFKFAFEELEPLSRWHSIESHRASDATNVIIEAEKDHQISISASLWKPDEEEKSVGIVLLHGSSPWGRKAGLIQLLGSVLRDEGFVVLAPDARGFGATDEPQNIFDSDAWSVKQDVRRVIDFLRALPYVKENELYVIGHSLGANHALEGALDYPPVKGLVLIGPSRYLRGNGSVTSRWDRARFSADRGLNDPIPAEIAINERKRGDIALITKRELSSDQHTPLLVIDGSKEGTANLRFLRSVASEIKPPKAYVTLQGVGHYCGVRNFFGGEKVYYQPETFAKCADVITKFIVNDGASQNEPTDLRNRNN